MANPSLQIGNDNWAIKEDNLLGYSTAGTRFVPQPITMTRATLGTRVNPSGLVEDVELLGSELVTNGDFASGTTDWTPNASATLSIDSDRLKINVSGAGSGYAHQTFTVENGKKYKCTGTIDFGTASQMRFYVSNPGQFFDITQSGNFDFTFTSTGTSTQVRLYTYGDGNYGFWDNISVKEATIDNLPRVDYTDGTSSLLVEPMRTNLIPESSDFTTWTTTGSAEVTPNTTISPDGTQNADTLNIFSGNFFYKPITSGAGTFTLSCYVKVASGTLDFKMQSFNGTDGADASSTFTANTNWQRFEFTTTVTTDSNFYPIQVSGLTGGDFLIWGAQLEAGSYPTSYIKTSGSTVTRNQETYTKTGISDKINSEEGVLFVEIAFSDAGRLAILNSDASDDQVVLGFSGTVFCRIRENGANVVTQFVSSANQLNTYYKIAVKYKSGSSAIWVDGNETVVAGTFTLNDLSKILFISEGSRTYGKVKQLQIFKTALSDSELATLTT